MQSPWGTIASIPHADRLLPQTAHGYYRQIPSSTPMPSPKQPLNAMIVFQQKLTESVKGGKRERQRVAYPFFAARWSVVQCEQPTVSIQWHVRFTSQLPLFDDSDPVFVALVAIRSHSKGLTVLKRRHYSIRCYVSFDRVTGVGKSTCDPGPFQLGGFDLRTVQQQGPNSEKSEQAHTHPNATQSDTGLYSKLWLPCNLSILPEPPSNHSSK